MTFIESLQKSIDFMENHLHEDISIEEIAAQGHVSPYHFQRMFMILTDMSVGEYLRKRRLTLAAQELATTDVKIIDLALKYGYDSPEAFTKAFRKQHGVSPSEARKGIGNLQSYNRLMIQVHLRGAEPMKYRIVEKDAFQAVGLKRVCPCGVEGSPNGIAEFWAEVGKDGTIDKLAALMNGEIKGLLGITDNYDAKAGTIDYWIAAEHVGDAPGSGFAALPFPAAKWVVFEVSGYAPTAIPNAWKQIFAEWIPSNGYELADLPALEAYTSPDPYRPDAVNQIWLAVK
jgi:AraC family transcriptional regulator